MKKEKPDMETFAAKIADKQDNPSIHELAKAFPEKTYKELEKYRNEDRHEEANQIPLTQAQKNLVDHIESAVEKNKKRKGICVPAELRKDREFENEIDYHRYWKDMYEKEHKLHQEAQEALANALEVDESHQRLNGKLQVRVAELEDDNKKMHDHLDKQVEAARKAGL